MCCETRENVASWKSFTVLSTNQKKKDTSIYNIRTVPLLFFFISNILGMAVTLGTTCDDVASYFMTGSFGSQIGFNKVNLVFIGPLAAAGRVL